MSGRLATLVAPLLATPLMLNYFGEAVFGLWATAVSITSIALFADLGIGNGLLTRVAAASGREQNDEIRCYVSSAYAALGAIAGTLIIISTVLYLGFYGPEALLIFVILVIFFVGLPATVFHQMLYGLQKVPTSNLFVALGSALSLACCFLAIRLGVAPWIVAAAYALPSVIVSFAGAVWFYWRRPELCPSLRAIEWKYVRDLLELGSRFFALSFLMAIGLNIDNLIISLNAGPEAVAAYSIPARLGSLLGILILTIFMPLWPAVGEALAREEHQWVKRSTGRMSLIGSVVVALGGVLLIYFSDWIMILWVGRTFADQHIILAFVVAASAAIAVTSPYNMTLNALGRVTIQIWPWVAFVLLSIPLKLALVRSEQLWLAAAITCFVYALIITPTILLATRRELRKL